MRRRIVRRGVLAAVAVAGCSLVMAAPAFAHVTVHPSSVAAGSSDVELVFRVPNERDDANTTRLQVFFPTSLPLLTVDVAPPGGWKVHVDTATLAKPIQTDDGPVSDVVTDVTWTATNGGIPPGQYLDFPVAVGSMPDTAGQLPFKSLQTYSSGEIVRWIEIASSTDPDPDTPAPILTLTKTGAAASGRSSTSSSSQAGPWALGSVALAVAVVALVVALLPVIRRRRGAT